MTTKEKIAQKATRLFNKSGFSAVNLLELAKQLGISRGNLTYHFKSKDDLLAHIADEMWEKMSRHREETKKLPSFENLHLEAKLIYSIQQEYAFIFLDRHVLNHPKLKKRFREMAARGIEDNKAIMAFSIEMGNLKKESFPGQYHNLAFISWMLIYFWLPQQVIRGEKCKDDGQKLIWTILLPHFTAKGLKRFKSFFGKDYVDNLGPAFELDLQSLIQF